MSESTGRIPESKKAQRTRARLVEATEAEISESGFFTAERVAARAGTSVATFYSHLPTKDDALTAAFSGVMDALVAVVDEHLKVERLLDRGLEGVSRDFVAACLDFFTARSLVFRCALARMPEHRPLREVYRAHESEAFSRYTRFVELGQAAGKIGSGNAETLARTLLVLSQGLNNPLALGLTESDPLGDQLARLVEILLAPGNEDRHSSGSARAGGSRTSGS